MSTHRCAGAIPAAGLSRRAVLNRFGLGLGGIALADLVNPLRIGATVTGPLLGRVEDNGPHRRRAAFPGEGEAGHLPVHGRWAVADRDLRRQAGAAHAQRRAAPGFGAPGPAPHRDVGQPVVAAAGGLAVRILATRPQRHVGLGPAAAHRQGGGRLVHRAVDVHRRDQSRSGHHVLPDRLADRGSPEHGRLGALRARQRHGRPAVVRRA